MIEIAAWAWWLVATATPVQADPRLDEFRAQALRAATRAALDEVRPGVFVCVWIDGHAPDAAQLDLIRSLHDGAVGRPDDCASNRSPKDDAYRRVGSAEAACHIAETFTLESFNIASVRAIGSCGPLDGGGRILEFRREAQGWVHVGNRGRIVI